MVRNDATAPMWERVQLCSCHVIFSIRAAPARPRTMDVPAEVTDVPQKAMSTRIFLSELPPKVAQVLKSLDTDGDGYLDSDEVRVHAPTGILAAAC